ncbi:class I adenylate-forming enzyme family protein [Brevibacterium renqingii]|uniref:class I adenylate-forming enzyme family protein n=1 Tax=Brevibacterium renqingii TaxID=2776916 RepID=UPI001AE06AFC|nr:AMP-binding protein [Brevibacterium renqingii]
MAATLVGELAAAATDSPKAEFLRTAEDSLTFAEVHELVEQSARTLVSLRVEQGERVGIRLPNGSNWVITWLAVLRIGAVAVPVNCAYETSDLDHVLSDSGASMIITDEEGRNKVEGTEAWATGSLMVVVDLVNSGHGTASKELPPLENITARTLANLQYTSGTTGFPKACMLAHEYWMTLGRRAQENVDADVGDVTITTQPFSYMDPQWNTTLCLLARIPLVIRPRFSASRFWDWVREEGVTFFYVLGTMPTLLYKQEPTSADKDNRVRIVMCSGIPPALHRQLEERWDAPWREAYGMTETGIDLCVPLAAQSSVGSGIIGWPVAGKEARVLSPDGSETAPGEQGELVVRGKPLMKGYWNLPDATAEVMRDGWFHTGDVVIQREDGAFRLVGRIKDMVRRGGENISSAEVENAANQHSDIIASAVVAVPDDLWGEQVKLFLLPKEGRTPSRALAEDVFELLQDHLARFKLPALIAFVDTFPLTPSERIIKSQIPEALATEGPGVFAMALSVPNKNQKEHR